MSRDSAFGTGRELKVARIGIDLGYLVCSRRKVDGPGDQLWLPNRWMQNARPPVLPALIEVKGTKDPPWRSGWGPKERWDLLGAAHDFFCEALLAWWPSGLSAPIWMTASDFPPAERPPE